MSKITMTAFAAALTLVASSAFAQASGAMSNDAMSHDSMGKNAMSHDKMGKDTMSHDKMGKTQTMKKDNAMGMGHPASGAMSQ